MQGGERRLDPGDGGKAKPSLEWDREWISSLQSPGSANRTGSSVILGLQLQEKAKTKIK